MNHLHRRLTRTIVQAIIATATIPGTASLLLSDLPTPSFIVDTQALRRLVRPSVGDDVGQDASALPFVPSIRCPETGVVLRPSMIARHANYSGSDDITVDCSFDVVEGQPAVGYIHSAVVRAREEAVPGEDDPLSTFLAEIDADPALCCGRARLVLGLNNHHVGGYYWARSAGAGSSMVAPGVSFGSGGSGNSIASVKSDRGVLRWMNDDGPEACNSNDGKRSEWVNFLRRGDTLQLVPADGQNSILRFRERFGIRMDDFSSSIRVFGISSRGRPMGSEPEVVCEWR
ncbi:hypothetical protein ACHAXA_001378 [Cyclostephanos tholiformis]|uniref:Uncharacterized protein n=1 Tax=Cyclostephanos tholiformis TaxID=382380 RepID=A0ABD3RE36_9STRA